MQEINNSNIWEKIIIDPVFEKKIGINSPKVDYNFLKNKPAWRSWWKYYALDLYQISWTKKSTIFLPVLWWEVGDIYRHYPSIDLFGEWNMSIYITKMSTLWEFPIKLEKWDIISAQWRNMWSGTFRFELFGWGYRLLYWDTLSISPNQKEFTIIVTESGMLQFKYGNDGNSNSISSFYIIKH